MNATDEDGDPLTFSIALTNNEDGESADFLSITQNGRVQGTPREDDVGEYTVRITVSDGTDAAIQEYVLTVNE